MTAHFDFSNHRMQRRWIAVFAFIFIGFYQASVEARVFDFKSEQLATYVRGTFGTSQLFATPYGNSSGTGVTTDKKSTIAASGEIGVLLSSQRMNLRLGVEFLAPQRFADVVGKNSSGATYFDLNSQTYAVVPMANLEFLAQQTPTTRLIFGVGGGYAYTTLINKYTMTTAGQAALGNDVTESAKAQSFAGQAYVGYETLFADTATVLFEAGYRYLPVAQLKSSVQAQAPAGTESPSSILINMDGTSRKIDLSGAYVGLSFRFYIGL